MRTFTAEELREESAAAARRGSGLLAAALRQEAEEIECKARSDTPARHDR